MFNPEKQMFLWIWVFTLESKIYWVYTGLNRYLKYCPEKNALLLAKLHTNVYHL